jgi:hypothetical protein
LSSKIVTDGGESDSVDRSDGTYTGDALRLSSPIKVTYARRFLIVKADPDNNVKETDENNNDVFVIPLLPTNQPAGFQASGAFHVYSKVTSAAEDTIAGKIAGRISRNTPDFTDKLHDFTAAWKSFGGSFKDEEPSGYKHDDHRVNTSLLGANGPLTKLMEVVKAADAQGRFSKTPLRINEAFDEQMEHRRDAQHYEGRSIDFSANGDRAKKLAGLAVLAGFRWSVNEVPSTGPQHVHVSHTGGKANLSISNLRRALAFGRQEQLVSESRYEQLDGKLNTALAAARNPNLSDADKAAAVRAALDAFIASIPDVDPPGFIVKQPSSLAGQPDQPTLIHLLLKRNAESVRNNADLWF